MAKTHLTLDGSRTLCGMDIASFAWNGGQLPTTQDPDAVTCSSCQRSAVRRADELPKKEAPYVPPPPRPAPPPQHLGRLELRILESSFRGRVDEPRYEWGSPVEAIAALAAFRADGQGIGSSSDPKRFQRSSPPKSSVGRNWRAGDPTREVTGQVERLAGVMRALDRAYEYPRLFGPVELPILSQREILVAWASLVHSGRGEGLKAEEVRGRVAAGISAAWDLEVTERQVQLVVRDGLERVRDHLRRIGELAPARKKKQRRTPPREDGSMLGYDLSGWGEISREMGVSERTCRRLAEREEDPLPVHRVKGVAGVYGRAAELREWVDRNSRSSAGAA